MIGSTTAESRRWPPVQEACTIWAFLTKCYVYAKGVRGSSARTPFLFCCSERQEYRLAVSSLPERSGQQSPQAPGQTIWKESEDGADILCDYDLLPYQVGVKSRLILRLVTKSMDKSCL